MWLFRFSRFVNSHERFTVVLYGCLFILPVIISSIGREFLYVSDAHATLPVYGFGAWYLKTYRTIPHLNPYIGLGLPVLGDPVSVILNPYIMLPFLLFGTDNGMRIILFLTVILSGLSMWWFLKSIGITSWARIWGALLYETQGVLAAKFTTGHFEQVFTYPVWPFYFCLITRKHLTWKVLILISISLTFMFYSGAIYTVWYAVIFFGVSRVFYVLSDRRLLANTVRQGIVIAGFFTLLSAVKLWDMLFRVMPQFTRSIPDPGLGSLHIPFSVLPFIIPFRVRFYETDPFKSWFGFYYYWQEYFAFISIFPFLLLHRVLRVWQTGIGKLLIISALVALLYVALGYPYSPFFWLNMVMPVFRMFRSPMRMLLPLSALFIAVMSMCSLLMIRSYSKTTRLFAGVILTATLIATFTVSQATLVGAFEPVRPEYPALARELKVRDGGSYYVAVFTCCMQKYLVEEKISVLNYYYAWYPTGSLVYATQAGIDFSELAKSMPRYVIVAAPGQEMIRQLKLLGYDYYFRNGIVMVYKTARAGIRPPV